MNHICIICQLLCLQRVMPQLVLVLSALTVRMVSVLEMEDLRIMNVLKTGEVTSVKVRGELFTFTYIYILT